MDQAAVDEGPFALFKLISAVAQENINGALKYEVELQLIVPVPVNDIIRVALRVVVSYMT